MATCSNCGWVHFGVTEAYAKSEVRRFNRYFNALSKKKQKDYYGGKKSSIKTYKTCLSCGGPYTGFRPSKEGDMPEGCTVNPIILVEGMKDYE